jgi:hypothetical protein
MIYREELKRRQMEDKMRGIEGEVPFIDIGSCQYMASVETQQATVASRGSELEPDHVQRGSIPARKGQRSLQLIKSHKVIACRYLDTRYLSLHGRKYMPIDRRFIP